LYTTNSFKFFLEETMFSVDTEMDLYEKVRNITAEWQDPPTLALLDQEDREALNLGLDPLGEFFNTWATGDLMGSGSLAEHAARRGACARWSWANIGPDSLSEMVDFVAGRGICEIGAGSGYVASQLTHLGCDVVAFDNDYDNGHWYSARTGVFYPVQKGDATTAGLHPDRVLLLSWPPYDQDLAFDAATAHRASGGTHLLYVGELWGCNAEEKFFALLDSASGCERFPVPSWTGIHDDLYLVTY
jgi:hypothetical protein